MNKFYEKDDGHIHYTTADAHQVLFTSIASNAFACLCALYEHEFYIFNLDKTHTMEIDRVNEIIWVRKK